MKGIVGEFRGLQGMPGTPVCCFYSPLHWALSKACRPLSRQFSPGTCLQSGLFPLELSWEISSNFPVSLLAEGDLFAQVCPGSRAAMVVLAPDSLKFLQLDSLCQLAPASALAGLEVVS